MGNSVGKVRIVATCLVLFAALAVQGCRDEEQGRILKYQKGTYLGKPDQQLTEAQREQLRFRTSRQRMR